MARRRAALAIAVALSAGAGVPRAQQVPETVTTDVLRVCADPANMPFSNRRAEGFENRIADVVAADLGVPLRYYWAPQGPGFVRNTLQTGLCDVIMGYAAGAGPVLHTNPYYRSAYVLVARSGSGLDGVDTLGDPRLRQKRIGVTAATPPVDHLNAHGLMADARTYPLLVDRRYESPGEAMVADLVSGGIDAAILWGPIGGYYARKAEARLTVTPLLKDEQEPPLAFRVTMGVRPGEQDWKRRLNEVLRRRQGEITGVLLQFGVPLVDEGDRPATGSSAPADSAPGR